MARLSDAEARGRRAVTSVLADVAPGSPVVVGVSGGADSLALAACAAFVARRDGHGVSAVVVDHALQEGSADVASRAAEQVRGLGLDVRVERVEVSTDGGPEGAARTARRGALLAGGEHPVLVAHTLDDQAETVLMGLGRGSGPRSVAGMRPVDGRWLRPFLLPSPLGLRRADTEQICRVHGLEPWDDPHNHDPRFRRARVRAEVIPLLDDVLGGGVVPALARTADLLRADVDLLDALAAEVTDPADVATLAALPPALRSRVLRRLVLDAGATAGELAAVHLADVDRLVTAWRGQDGVDLPGRVRVVRREARLHVVGRPVAG